MVVLSAEEIRALNEEADQLMLQHEQNLDFETGIRDAEEILRDLTKFPHHFVLACVMDRQIKAARAWRIPYEVGLAIGGFDFKNYETLTPSKAKELFRDRSLHRFNDTMAALFVRAIQRIRSTYEGRANLIWANNPPSAAIIRRFLEFDGVGIKIATMATNLLLRKFRVAMTDKSAIDISPDSQVMKFFQQKKWLREEASIPELVYLARELSPDYPGRLDALAWRGGRAMKRKTQESNSNL
jgi:endonuclease III